MNGVIESYNLHTMKEKTNNGAGRMLAVSILRVLIGWHFLYEGIIKILNPSWTAKEFLLGSRGLFSGLFHWIASGDQVMQVVDFLNAWGLTFIGLALILGLFTRTAAWSGVVLLSMYYLAYIPWGYNLYGTPSEGSYLLVNKTLIELVALVVVGVFSGLQQYKLENLFETLKNRSSDSANNLGEDEKTAVGRRELLKSLAGLPVLGVFSWLAIKDDASGSVDAVSGTTIKVDFKGTDKLEGTLPKGKIGNLEISRLVMGCNLIGGWAHARDLIYVGSLFKAYNSEGKVMETLALAEEAGINTMFITSKYFDLVNKYKKIYGGKIQTICQAGLELDGNLDDIKLSIDSGMDAIYIQGAFSDRLIKNGKSDILGMGVDYIKKNGYPAGIGGHALTVIKTSEQEQLNPDFYVKTMHHDRYWSAHPRENRVEFSVDAERNADHNMIHDNMFDLFPEQTVEFMQNVEKPWFAFKVLAGGAIHPEDGFKYAFSNGADFICVGMFDFQVVDNVNTTCKILNENLNRQRVWRA